MPNVIRAPFPFVVWPNDNMRNVIYLSKSSSAPSSADKNRSDSEMPHRTPRHFLAPYWASNLDHDDPRLQWPHPEKKMAKLPTGKGGVIPKNPGGMKTVDWSIPAPAVSPLAPDEPIPSLHSPSMKYIGSPSNGQTFKIDTQGKFMPPTKRAPGLYEDTSTGRHYIIKTGLQGAAGIGAPVPASVPMRSEVVAHKLYKIFATKQNGIAPVDARLHSDELQGMEVPAGSHIPHDAILYGVTPRLQGAKTIGDVQKYDYDAGQKALATASKGWVIDALLNGNHGDLHTANLMVNADGSGVYRIDPGAALGMAWDGSKDPDFWENVSKNTLLRSMRQNTLLYSPHLYVSPKDSVRQIKEAIDTWDSKTDEIKKAVSYHHLPDDLFEKLSERINVLRRAYATYKNNPEQLWQDLHWSRFNPKRNVPSREEDTKPISDSLFEKLGPEFEREIERGRRPRGQKNADEPENISRRKPSPASGVRQLIIPNLPYRGSPSNKLTNAQRRQKIWREMMRDEEIEGEPGAQKFLFGDRNKDVPTPVEQLLKLNGKTTKDIPSRNRLWGTSAAGFRTGGEYGPRPAGEGDSAARGDDAEIRAWLEPRIKKFLAENGRLAQGAPLTDAQFFGLDNKDGRARAKRYQFWKEFTQWINNPKNDRAARDLWMDENPGWVSEGRSKTANWRSDAKRAPDVRRPMFAGDRKITPRPPLANETFEEWLTRQKRDQRARYRKKQAGERYKKILNDIDFNPLTPSEIGNIGNIPARELIGSDAGPPLTMSDVAKIDPKFLAGQHSRALNDYFDDEFLSGGKGARRLDWGNDASDIRGVRKRAAKLNRAALRRWLQGRAIRRDIQRGLIDPRDISYGKFGLDRDKLLPPFNRNNLGPWTSSGEYGKKNIADYRAELQGRKRARLDKQGKGSNSSQWKSRRNTEDAWYE